MLNFDVRGVYKEVEGSFYEVKSLQEEILAKEDKLKTLMQELKEIRYSFGSNMAKYIAKNVSKRFCTVTQLLNNYIQDQELFNKNLSTDFIYVYEDAVGQHRLIYPLKFVAFSIYDRKEWKKGNYQKHKEEYIINYIKDFTETSENWYTDVFRADSLNVLSRAGVQVRSAFEFLDRQRNLPHNSKDHKISVYNVSDLEKDEEILTDGQKLILQINKFLKTYS